MAPRKLRSREAICESPITALLVLPPFAQIKDGITSIPERKKQKANLMVKILNKRTPEYLLDLFRPFTTEYDLRDKTSKLTLSKPRAEFLKGSPC